MNRLKTYFLLIFLFVASASFAQQGCTDYQATNFDPAATINDGSCVYPPTTLSLTFKCYIDSIELSETSGIANQDNNFWTHVDDSENSIYRIDTLSDSIFQKVTINNATNYDWEDITADSAHIYVGDVGNNDGNRTNLRFYKILKSDITPATTTVNAGRINFSYADQVDFTVNHNYNYYDCEAFFYLNDSIHIFTKGWVNRWTKHYVLPADTGTQVAQLVDSFNVTSLITSAAIQGDSLVVLLGLNFSGGNACYVWMFNKFQGSRFFSGNKRRFSIGSPFAAGQAEGICFADTNKGYITNERIQLGSTVIPARLREFNLNQYLAPPPPSAEILTSVSSVVQQLKACSDSGSASFTITNTTSGGGPDLHFTIGGLPPWISVSPASDTLAPGDSAVIVLGFTSGVLSAGIYASNVSIQSNDPLHPVQNIYCTLNVDSNPCMDFNYTTDTCSGSADFTSLSVNTPVYYHWDFGDGDTSLLENPTHQYPSDGNYLVRLIGCNSTGCDTVLQNVQVIITGAKAANCYPVTQSYCCGLGITHFRLTGPSGDVLNNYSNDAIAGFEDFACDNPGTMITNYPYTLTCTTALSYSEYLKVWLDMNNDGIFDSVTEELFSGYDTLAPLHSGTLTVPVLPSNVYGVPLRMRVSSDYGQIPQPCINALSGQHEDYSVVLSLATHLTESETAEILRVYPNPFTQSTGIDYAIKQTSDVSLDIYSVTGNKVNSPVASQMQSPGTYRLQCSGIPPGVYFVKLSVNGKTAVKMIVKSE